VENIYIKMPGKFTYRFEDIKRWGY